MWTGGFQGWVRGEKKGGELFNGYRISDLKDEKFRKSVFQQYEHT